MSRFITISTGRKVHIDSDGIVDIESNDFKLLNIDDQELLSMHSDRESARSCGFPLGRSSFDVTTGGPNV